MDHIITADTPLDPDMLRFRSLHGNEALSSLYDFRVELVSPSASIDMHALLGKPLNLRIALANGDVRHLGGHVARCEFAGRETVTSRSYVYEVTLRPWLWYLSLNSDCRIFQNLPVTGILREVFGSYGFAVEERLIATYRSWDYCVQYRESDFAFASRLMEQEGIYYFFRHEAGQQVLVLADDMSAHDPLPHYATLPYLPPERLVLPDEDGIDAWRPAAQISTGACTVDDYDFRKPNADLSQLRAQPLTAEHGSYAKYVPQSGYIDADEGEHYARMRLEEEQASHARAQAHTHLRATAPGFRFTLERCPRQSENQEYLLAGVRYRLQEGGYASGSGEARYDFDFVAQPASVPYRAPSVTPVPKASGPQTAVVVGPAGEEIWTDRFGRVKLQFRWDRRGRRDENSSCWVRVSDAWAGSNYGGIHVPRIGQEVVVDFINGELDRPLITGRIYNAAQMPPFALPDAATQSGFVTRTPGGTGANANMLRFEDKRGAEQLALHAERNYDVSVENDASHDIGRDEGVTIARNATRAVGNDASTSIARNETYAIGQDSQTSIARNETRSVGNDYSASISNNETYTVGNDRSASTANDETHNVGHDYGIVVGHDMTHRVGSNHTIAVAQDATQSVGGNSGVSVASNSTTTVGGSSSSTVDGNSSMIVSGTLLMETADMVSIAAAAFGLTGLSMSAIGSSVMATGSFVTATGSSVAATGSSVSATGSSVSSVGSSVSATGVSFNTVGLSVTF